MSELSDIVKKQEEQFDIKKMCRLLGICRGSYYYCTQMRKNRKLNKENQILRTKILKIYHREDGVYGAPKIRDEIVKSGIEFGVSIRRVGKIMKSLGIRSVVIKKYRPYKIDSVYNGGNNLLNQDFSANQLNQKWVSDITYIHTMWDGWVYLASIMDLASKKIIGWSISKFINTDLILGALSKAVQAVGKDQCKGVILHSDRGCQYTSHAYQAELIGLEIRQSFSQKGCPYDNAPIESWHALLKKEYVYRRVFKNFQEAELGLFSWIDGKYNRNRTHSALHYLTPQQMEDLLKAA